MRVQLYWDQEQETTKIRLLEDIEACGLVVPRDFESDGASIPKALWGWASPLDARYIQVFVFHDFVYATGCLSREDADQLMRKGLIQAGMAPARAWTIYRAVRMFGGGHYMNQAGNS